MAAHHRGSSRGGYESDAVAQFLEAASLQDLITLRQRTICTILVYEGVDALTVEEVLDGLAILLLPLAISTAPLVVEGDVHGHTPRVVAEVVAAIATGFFAGLGLGHAREAGHLHL